MGTGASLETGWKVISCHSASSLGRLSDLGQGPWLFQTPAFLPSYVRGAS